MTIELPAPNHRTSIPAASLIDEMSLVRRRRNRVLGFAIAALAVAFVLAGVQSISILRTQHKVIAVTEAYTRILDERDVVSRAEIDLLRGEVTRNRDSIRGLYAALAASREQVRSLGGVPLPLPSSTTVESAPSTSVP